MTELDRDVEARFKKIEDYPLSFLGDRRKSIRDRFRKEIKRNIIKSL